MIGWMKGQDHLAKRLGVTLVAAGVACAAIGFVQIGLDYDWDDIVEVWFEAAMLDRWAYREYWGAAWAVYLVAAGMILVWGWDRVFAPFGRWLRDGTAPRNH